MAAKKLGIKAKIVMPKCTPSIKVQAVQRFGACVLLHGNDFDEAKQLCAQLIQQHGYINIPPFDDPLIIAGQGTCAVELMRQGQKFWTDLSISDRKRFHSTSSQPLDLSPLNISNVIGLPESDCGIDAVFCAVGGGGLAAGLVSYIKRLFPHVKVFGVETNDANSMYLSLARGKPVELDEVGLFAEGAAVRLVGSETFRVCSGHYESHGLDGVVLVSNDEICAAIKDVFTDTRTGMSSLLHILHYHFFCYYIYIYLLFILHCYYFCFPVTYFFFDLIFIVLETAGALGVAGLKKWAAENKVRGARLVAVTSGANMSFDRLRFVADRARIGEEKEALISVIIPEKPGRYYSL
jgi:threonine dehydratase